MERVSEDKVSEVLYEQPQEVYSNIGPSVDSNGTFAGLNGHARGQNGVVSSHGEYAQVDLSLRGRAEVHSPQYCEVPGVSIHHGIGGSAVYYEVKPNQFKESREPQDYALPVASGRSTLESQPYEVPVQCQSNHTSLQV